jgi:peptidoglycan-associated lipoprotein
MTFRGNHLIRLAVALLLIGSVSANCSMLSGMRKAPRQHWWEFWKPKKPQTTDLYYPDNPADLPGPAPSAVAGEAQPGVDSVLPIEPPSTLPSAEVPASIPEVSPVRRAPAGMVNELRTIHFDFDSSQLTDPARQTLDNDSQFLLEHPEVRVQIAGHCDERGTQEYNMSLGQRRADAAREYLVRKGVPPTQMTVISYGEDRPAAVGHDEAAWQQNRRAEFQIY